jgi:hypothetical protein
VLLAVAAIVAGLAVTAPRFLLHDRDYVAVTPQPPTPAVPTGVRLPVRR